MKAISSMATRQVLADLADAAVAAGLPRLEVESVGGVDAARRVREGERFDLVVLAEGAMTALAADGLIEADTLVPIVVSSVAVAVRSAGAPPAVDPGAAAFSDEGRLRDALAGAGRIGYSTGPSGTALLAMIQRWGLRQQIDPRLVQARPGVPVAALLASGDVDIALQQLSELVGQPGIRILGTLPVDCAIDTVFAGAVGAGAVDRASASEVLSYLASPEVAQIKADRSFASPGDR